MALARLSRKGLARFKLEIEMNAKEIIYKATKAASIAMLTALDKYRADQGGQTLDKAEEALGIES
jgi:hypothetical protein